jgi:RNA polymerase sigma factor (sigma-70 family)
MYNHMELLTVNTTIRQMIRQQFRHMVSKQQQDDVAQDLMEKIIRKQLQHNPDRGTLKSWLYSLIYNHLTDIFRKKKRTPVVGSLELHKEPEDSGSSAMDYEMEHLERLRQYQVILATESERNRQIIELFYEQRLTDRQIGEQLNMEASAVTMRRSRARERMKRKYRTGRDY